MGTVSEASRRKAAQEMASLPCPIANL